VPRRTSAFRLLTRLPRRWVLAVDRAARRHRALVRALGPARSWLRRGAARIPAGPAEGLLLSLAYLPVSHSQARPLARGVLEPPVQQALECVIEPGHVVYDIGANVGFFSLLAARLAGATGRVVAVEPAPQCAAAVRANADLNGLATITVLEVAAGATAHRERLWVVADQSWSHLESRGRHPDAIAAVETEVVVLDELVASGELPPPDVVKLDIEGSELEALAGMRATIATHRPVLVCEVHDTNAAVADLLDELDYCSEVLDGPGPLREADVNAHVLARPR